MTKDVQIAKSLMHAIEGVALELEGLHSRLERLEYGLDMLFVHTDNSLDAKSITMLQELDMLRQSMGALGDYLMRLTVEVDETGCIDFECALRNIPLRDMAERLSGAKRRSVNTGCPELF